MPFKITIIIPVYNASLYLKECLDSVLNQTLKNTEIICIDDGSTDNSYEILHEYATKDNRFIILQQENKGAGAARNKGMEIAKGKFLAFLDADDYYSDNTALEKLYLTAINNNILIAGAFRQHLKINGQIINHPLHRHFFTDSNNERIFNYTDVQYDYHYHGYIFNKEIIDKYNLGFPLYKRFQDPPFFVKAMFYAKQFIIIPIEFYVFRESERCNSLFNSEKTCDLMRGLNDNLEFSSKNNLAILHYVTAKRFLGEFFFTIADNLYDTDSGIVEILFKSSSLLNYKLIDEAKKLTKNEKWISVLKTMEIHNFEILPEKLENYNNLPADDKIRLAFLARMAKERIIFNNEKWHFIHENETLKHQINKLTESNSSLRTNISILERDNNNLTIDNRKLNLQINKLNQINTFQKSSISNLKLELNKIKNEIVAIKKSFSYKLGLIITWIPRKIFFLANIRRDKK